VNTKIYHISIDSTSGKNPEEVLSALTMYSEIGLLLRNGEIVAFPTETVYGLGANAFIPLACKKVYEAKGRPSDNPMIVHIADHIDLDDVVESVTPVARLLIDKFWPGPLTVVLKKGDKISRVVTGGLDTVAVRMPIHPVGRSIIRCAGVPIAAPSANLSGKPSPTKCSHVIDDLNGKISAIVCSDDSDIGLESTVVDCTGEVPVILRPGSITAEMIREAAGDVALNYDEDYEEDEKAPKSPGLKYKHYAPDARCVLFEGSSDKVVEAMKSEIAVLGAEKTGVLAFDETKGAFSASAVKSMGSMNDPEGCARNLYAVLREFNDTGVETILIQGLDESHSSGIFKALENRISKASSGKKHF
jgi:L-threonylcarbamoyladenylate synthase